MVFADRESATGLRSELGDNLKLYITSSADCVWMAVGPEALPLLKHNATQKNKQVAAVELRMKLAPLAQTAAGMIDHATLQPVLNAAGASLAGRDDRVDFTLEAVDGGLRARLVAHEGVLRAGAMGLALKLLFGD